MVRRTLTLLSVVSYTVALQHASALLIHGRAVDGSKQPDETTKYCDSGEIYERSYLMPKRFPFPPIRLVMETASKTCDFYKDRDFCRAFSEDRNFEPEQHVKSALASFLDGCHSRECAAIDLGGNNGWMSAYMYSLGANPVYTVEPAADLAQALRDTITLNCWKGRGEVITGFAIAGSESLNGALPAWLPKNMPADNGWRAGGRPENLSLPLAPVIPLDDILLKRPRMTALSAPRGKVQPPQPEIGLIFSPDVSDFLVEYDLTPEQRALAEHLKAEASLRQMLHALADHALHYSQEIAAARRRAAGPPGGDGGLRARVLAWFSSLGGPQRVSLLTCDDPGWVRTALQMMRLCGA
ncbi:unnamed protein product, partial [Prorocentrum cordatum]